MKSLLFNGKVAVVTGAGGGLGRIYSIELAKRGASLIINDLGSFKNGEGRDISSANNVVDEINKMGGIAVANYDSVENGDKIVQAAIKTFGKIDILINNAGVLRDKSFSRITDEDWNRVINIHLQGAYKTTKEAWNYMKTQNYGRIIFTTSASGIYGNFGQSNYSTAKSSLIGFSKTLSLEGRNYNINCNAIAPIAGSRMTEDVFPEDLFNSLKPEHVSPLVLYLCHEKCSETGSLFEVGAGWIGKVRVEVNNGKIFNINEGTFTPEMVEESWDQITNFSNTRHPKTIKESMENFINSISSSKEIFDPNQIVTMKDLIGKRLTLKLDPFSAQDLILYALSVGVSGSDLKDLKFLYENHENFCSLPTFAVVPSLNIAMKLMNKLFNSPYLGISILQVLHGEQFLEMYKSFPINEDIYGNAEIVDVLDKMRGALIVINVNLFDSKNEKISFVQINIYVKGFGRFGGSSTSDLVMSLKPKPSKDSDFKIEVALQSNQAIMYRLNGDLNPLHIDSEIAKLSGFDKPILHGLCLYGIVGTIVLKKILNNDVEKFKSFKVRFSKPVKPGQKITIEIWKNNNGFLHIQAKIKETQDICLSGGYITYINDNIQNPKI